MKSFSISVLCCNRLEYTKKCVESVLSAKNESKYELILTDNGSADKTLEYLMSLRDDKIKVIYSEHNLGFNKGHEYNLKIAKHEYFLLLNNDTVVSDYWLDEMGCAFNDDLVKLVGVHPSKINAAGNGYRTNPLNYDYIEGDCIAVPTEFIKKFGLFDPDYKFCYNEDVDLCFRLKKAGYKLNVANTYVVHERSILTLDTIPSGRSMINLNKKVFFEKWGRYLETGSFDK